MKRYIYSIFAALASLLIFSACQSDKEPASLSVGTEALTLAPEASETPISVQSSSSDWSAVAEAEWLTVSRSGAGFVLKASANPEASARTSAVKVFIEGASKTIAVTQTAASNVLQLLTSSELVPFLARSSEFYIKTNINASSLEVSSTADWLKPVLDISSNRVSFSVEENPANEERRASLQFSYAGQPVGEPFLVIQEAKPIYYLPSPNWGSTAAQVRSFEDARGNPVTRLPNGFGSGWGFKTRSNEFNYIEYLFTAQRYYIARLYTSQSYKDKAFGEDEGKLIKFLEGQGFVKSTTEDDSYYSVAKKISVKFVRKVTQSSGLTPYLEYTLHSVQDQAYPTLPIEGFLGIFNDYDGDKAKYVYPTSIDAHEAGRQSQPNTQFTRAGRAVYNAKSPYLLRFYAYSTNTSRINVASCVLDSHSYVFFKNDLDNLVLTNEFKELMANNGFENTVKEPDLFIFINSKRAMSLTVFYQKFEFFPTETKVGIQVRPI